MISTRKNCFPYTH